MDIEDGESGFLWLTHLMSVAGGYTVDISMTPPEEPFLEHIFDSKTITFDTGFNGLERRIQAVVTDNDKITTYQLQNAKDIKYDEMAHVIINLPEVHTYEKITIINGKFIKEFSIDKKDIYIKSDKEFENMKVNLVKEGNLLPLADAQNNLLDYVLFFTIDKDNCYNIVCVNVDFVEEEFPYWMLIVTGIVIAIVVVFLRRKKDPSKTNPQILSSNIFSMPTKRSEWGNTYVEPKNTI